MKGYGPKPEEPITEGLTSDSKLQLWCYAVLFFLDMLCLFFPVRLLFFSRSYSFFPLFVGLFLVRPPVESQLSQSVSPCAAFT